MGLSADADRRLRRRFERIPVFNTLGFEFLELGEGVARLRVPRRDEYNGVYTTFHGGLLATVADCAAWVAIVTRLGPESHLTTSDLNIRFLEPCFGDVIAVAEVLKFGRTLCPVTVDLADPGGTRVALAQVTYFRMQRAPGA